MAYEVRIPGRGWKGEGLGRGRRERGGRAENGLEGEEETRDGFLWSVASVAGVEKLEE